MAAKPRTAYARDVARNVKRSMVRLDKETQARIEKARARHSTYAPTVSAIIRRGIELACKELDEKEVVNK